MLYFKFPPPRVDVSSKTKTNKHQLTSHPGRSIKVNGVNCGVEALVLGATTSIGGFLFGYDTGLISAVLLFRDFVSRFAQTNDDGDKEWVPIIKSLLVSLMSIGCLIGALSGA